MRIALEYTDVMSTLKTMCEESNGKYKFEGNISDNYLKVISKNSKEMWIGLWRSKQLRLTVQNGRKTFYRIIGKYYNDIKIGEIIKECVRELEESIDSYNESIELVKSLDPIFENGYIHHRNGTYSAIENGIDLYYDKDTDRFTIRTNYIDIEKTKMILEILQN